MYSRALKICDSEFIDSEINHITDTFLGLGYPKYFIQRALSISKKRFYAPSTNKNSDSQKKLVVPYSRTIENCKQYIKYDKDIDIVFKYENTIRKRLVKNKLERGSQDKGVYIIPCKDCDNLYVGETGRNLSVRLDEHRNACSKGLDHNAVATHTLSLDHRINFKDSKIIYKEPNVTKRRVAEGALIHSLKTFKNNKSFNDEDDVISNFISHNVLAAHSPVVSSLFSAQTQGIVALQQTHDVGTDAEDRSRQGNDHQPPDNPPVRRSERVRQRLIQDLDPD